MKQSKPGLKRLYLASTLLMGLISVLSCKKTELIPYEKEANNTILEYRVTNTLDTLFGAIDNIKNTITLYVPYYMGIDHIVPDIKIDKEAKLLDATGSMINLDGGVEPVPVDTTGYAYTVMGSNNSKRVYTLILQIAPHPDTLRAGYQVGGSGVDYTTSIQRAVYSRIPIYGNFGSTSAGAKFTLTNRATGKSYIDLLKVYQVTPGAAYYMMEVDVSAYADSGYYDVQVKHQGRTAQLPPLHLVYNKAKFTNLKSTAAYAPGDTVVFAAKGHSIYDADNTSVIGLERVYLKFAKSGFSFGGSVPAAFPDDLFGQQLEMKIVSVTRTEVKAIFPDVPAGAIGSYIYSFTLDFPGIGFYFDFNDATGWGKNNMLCTTGRLFTINAKK